MSTDFKETKIHTYNENQYEYEEPYDAVNTETKNSKQYKRLPIRFNFYAVLILYVFIYYLTM